MNISRAMVHTPDSPEVYQIDVIEYEGKLWLVPLWLSPQDGKWQTPARIIRFDHLKHQNRGLKGVFEYTLQAPIPTAVLNGTAPPQEAAYYEVIERPNIQFPVGNS